MRRILKIVLPMMGRGVFPKYIFLGILSGAFSFLFISLVTKVVGLLISGNLTTVSAEYVIIFALVILLYIWTRKTLSLAIVNLSQKLLWGLRKQILALVLKAGYEQLSSRKVKIRTAVLNDVYVLTDASMNIIGFFTSLIMGIACLIYLSTISFLLFLITLGIAALGAGVYYFSSTITRQGFEKYRELENGFMESFNDILDGFKEIFMEPVIGRNIYDKKITVVAEASYQNGVKAFTGFLSNQIIGQVLSYLLISSVLLYFSVTLHIKAAGIVSFVFTLMYLLGAIEAVMVVLPGLMRARIAANNLMNLKKELEEAEFTDPEPIQFFSKADLERVTLKGLTFSYDGIGKSFAIGPVSLEIRRGETVFIYGGNGSGKTTLIHSILGICTPTGGEIRMNDILIDQTNNHEYRKFFSVVFSDFHLFNELLSLDKLDEEKWNYYLRVFELDEKITIDGMRFSTTDLSTGQRKRLALIAALLEEKPILVIDEWAADQDPYFRKKFYTEIIPLLKEEGITIIAITHDDKYYHCADKIFKMEYGKLTEEKIEINESRLIFQEIKQ